MILLSGDGSLVIEDARIIFRNFAGKEGKFNREGDRSFCVLLDEDTASRLIADGWNVRGLRAREEGEPDQPYLHVSIGFKIRPPKMMMIGSISGKRTELDEDTCEVLDWVSIKTVDLSVRPYHWNVGEKNGIKAYLQTLYITVAEDYLTLKYDNLEHLPTSGGQVFE